MRKQHAYSYLNKERCEEFVEYRPVADEIAEQAEEIALAAWRVLECRDAGRLDLRADGEGRIHFLEVNPLPGPASRTFRSAHPLHHVRHRLP